MTTKTIEKPRLRWRHNSWYETWSARPSQTIRWMEEVIAVQEAREERLSESELVRIFA